MTHLWSTVRIREKAGHACEIVAWKRNKSCPVRVNRTVQLGSLCYSISSYALLISTIILLIRFPISIFVC